MKFLRSTVLLLPLLLLGCAATSEPTSTLSPTFGAIQKAVFTPTCAVSGCHTGQLPTAVLGLDAARSYFDLLHKPMENSDAYKYFGGRVVPGQPDSSFLLAKLAYHEDTLARLFLGSRMPQRSEPLAQYKIDAIRHWIKDGAQNN